MALIEQKGTISAFGDIREGTGKSGYHWQRQNIVLEYQVEMNRFRKHWVLWSERNYCSFTHFLTFLSYFFGFQGVSSEILKNLP